MQARAVLVLGLLVPALVAGCASKLSVSREKAGEKPGETEPVAGLPFNVPEVYVKSGTRTASSKADDKECTPVEFHETVLLPTGARHYLNVEAMPFTKTGFVVRYNASGNLSEVTLNTEPAGAEEIKAVADLVKTIAPIAGFAPATKAESRFAKACDAGEKDVRYCTLAAFQAGECR